MMQILRTLFLGSTLVSTSIMANAVAQVAKLLYKKASTEPFLTCLRPRLPRIKLKTPSGHPFLNPRPCWIVLYSVVLNRRDESVSFLVSTKLARSLALTLCLISQEFGG